MLAGYDWKQLDNLSHGELRSELWALFRAAALETNKGGRESPELLEVVPRIVDIVQRREIAEEFGDPLNQLARVTGLWNYIDRYEAGPSERIVADAATFEELDDITLHRKQLEVLDALRGGRNIILSAPTSFGKSLLIDALLLEERFRRVAIVVPTIALLDEFRRRLARRFEGRFDFVLHPSDRADSERVLFLGTQERLINRTDLGRLDLTVVDEFYKLDPKRRDERHVSLNSAVYGLLNRSRQFFFLGPNIDEVFQSPDVAWDFQFIRTRTGTVAVDTFDLSKTESKDSALFEAIAEDSNWPALVFASSPDRANKLAAMASERMAVGDDGWEFAEWLSENVGARWPLVKAVHDGFAVHHGRIPRSIASHMIRLFNDMVLPVMFCTSTLIEGVNTAAKSVMVYDRTIDGRNYDYFTFSNIRGRAGRLGQHYVGQVFLFEPVPEPSQTDVAPTFLGDDEDAPDDYVVQLDEEFTSFEQDDRIAGIAQLLGLDSQGLKLASRLGLDIAYKIKTLVDDSLNNNKLLVWKGHPNSSQLKHIMKLISAVKAPQKYGAASLKQLIYYMNSLEYSNKFKYFLQGHDRTFTSDMKYYESVFKFLRSCEYGLPQVFSVIEAFVKTRHPEADYRAYVYNMSHWFRDPLLKNLDEEGIPIQISERFFRPGDSRASLVEKLATAVNTMDSRLSNFERNWVAKAL